MGSRRRRRGLNKNHLPASSEPPPAPCYHATAKKKAHTGIIFTLLDYFPRAPPGERRSEGVRQREEWQEVEGGKGWTLCDTRRGVKRL